MSTSSYHCAAKCHLQHTCQSSQSTIFQLQNIFQGKSWKNTKLPSRQNRAAKVKLTNARNHIRRRKKNYFYEETLNIFCVKSLSSQFDIFSVDWTEDGPVTKRVLARWRYWCSRKYKVGLSCIYITTKPIYTVSPSSLSLLSPPQTKLYHMFTS